MITSVIDSYLEYLLIDAQNEAFRLEINLVERLRELLARSHVAAVVIALLLLWSLCSLFRVLWPPIFAILEYVFTAVAILDIPYHSGTFGLRTRMDFVWICVFFYSALVDFAAAWLLSRWVFGVSPLRCLGEYRRRLIRSRNA